MPTHCQDEQATLFSLDMESAPNAKPDNTLIFAVEQAPGTIVVDGSVFRYTGYVLDTEGESERFRPIACVCTAEELLVDPQCDPDRIRCMLDAVGASIQRQKEIRLYGKRVWHSPWRPEPAWEQALDWAFAHDVAVIRVLSNQAKAFFLRVDPATGDTWIHEVRLAYGQRRFEPARLIRAVQCLQLPAERLETFCRQVSIHMQEEFC
jgi:hypothetical protein